MKNNKFNFLRNENVWILNIQKIPSNWMEGIWLSLVMTRIFSDTLRRIIDAKGIYIEDSSSKNVYIIIEEEECKNDKFIWINEILYLYDKWKIKYIDNGPLKNNLIFIINNFKINSFSDFKNNAQKNKKLPKNLRIIFLKIQCDNLIIKFKNNLRTYYSRFKY